METKKVNFKETPEIITSPPAKDPIIQQQNINQQSNNNHTEPKIDKPQNINQHQIIKKPEIKQPNNNHEEPKIIKPQNENQEIKKQQNNQNLNNNDQNNKQNDYLKIMSVIMSNINFIPSNHTIIFIFAVIVCFILFFYKNKN